MMKFLLQSALLGLLVLLPLKAVFSDENQVIISTRRAETPIRVELAETPQQQVKGLMHRDALAADAGMLFLFPGSPREIRMWMKDTALPLDMLFLKPNGTIHRIAANTTPYSTEVIFSQGPVSAVLEIPAGTAARLGAQPGDRVLHERLKE